MRLYRALLHLYPASFRAEYGPELCALFARARGGTSGIGLPALWLRTCADVAWNAAAVHLDILRQDLRYTLRTLSRARGFAFTAMLIVALGIGATTAAFSVTDFVLIRPLPFPEADRLVKLWQKQPGYARMELSPANYRDWKEAAGSFERTGAYTEVPANIVGLSEPQHVDGALVTADLLPTLAVQPALGRVFRPEDDREGAPGTLILSDELWRSSFGGDPSILGRRVILDDRPYEVIGVMPRSFQFPTRDALYWRTFRLGPGSYEDRNDNWLLVVGRLKPGVSLERARAEMDLLAAQLVARYPKENEHVGANVFRLRDELSTQSRMLLWALGIAAGCVLLIACANLANLLLARAMGRRQELAVRTAMGAGRERLVRQLATESVTLAVAGGTLGVGLAALVVPLLAQLVPMTLPMPDLPGVDLRVLSFAAVATALTGVTFGLAPILGSGRRPALDGLREGVRSGGGRKERLRSALVVAEVVASVVLLVACGLLVRALARIQSTDPGFRTEGVLTLRTELPLPRYLQTASRTSFYDRVLSEVRALPGVQSAAYISFLPMTMRGGIWPVGIQGTALARTDGHTAALRYVTPQFFAAMGIPFHAGRDVRDSDDNTTEMVAVVSESLARRYWPDGSALGRRFQFAFKERTIVGIVGDVRFRGLERESEPQVYLPARQVDDGSIIGYRPGDLVVKATGGDLMASIRAIIGRADGQLPISNVRTMSEIVELDTASRSVQARVLGGFAVIAFVLAAVGIHGVLAFAVSQRTNEIGVRVALGATRGDILGMVLKQGARLAIGGIVPGLALAYLTGRHMESLLAGVKPWDPAAYGWAAALCLVMVIAGSLLPTLRAVRIDPVRALRAE